MNQAEMELNERLNQKWANPSDGTRYIATLGSAGWISDPIQKAAAAMQCYLLADQNQSNIFQADVVSLIHTIAESSNNRSLLQENVARDLNMLLGRLFDQANVNVTIAGFAPVLGQTENILDIQIDVTLIDRGQRYDLAKLLKLSGQTVIDFKDRV